MAKSFSAWLETQASRLERGELVVIEYNGGTYNRIAALASLNGRLALCHIRGENVEGRRPRIEHTVLANPDHLTGVVLSILKRGRRFRLQNPSDETLTLWPAVRAVVGGPNTSEAERARAVLQAASNCPGVERCEVTAEQFAADLTAELC